MSVSLFRRFFLAPVTFGVLLASFFLVTWNWISEHFSGQKVVLSVPFDYDNFTNFFSNSYIWRFTCFIISCDMKLDLSEHFSDQKVVLRVSFDYDDFADFFSSSYIWRFSCFILTCDLKLDLSEHFSDQKVVPGVPFDYDDFANFFANSCIWRFSGILVTKKSHLVSPSKWQFLKLGTHFYCLDKKIE